MKCYPKLLLILVFTSFLYFFSCREKVEYPIIPYIEYVDFMKYENSLGINEKGILKISFTDGDGDIGLDPSDTLYPFNPGSQWYYDLFITYYERQNGEYVAVELPMSNNSRIPVVTPEGENKSIKGEIEVELFTNNPLSTFDTICFEAQIADRALHVSNVIKTPDIVIKK